MSAPFLTRVYMAKKTTKPAKKVAKAPDKKAKPVKAAPKAKAAPKEKAAPKAWRPDYGSILSVAERKSKLSSNMQNRFDYALHSGLLVQDLLLGGGYVSGGMYTNVGGEQSAKSTNCSNFQAQLLSMPDDQRPGIIVNADPEGSTDANYLSNMMENPLPPEEIFGQQNKKGEYTIEPLIRYYPENRGELLLNGINMILRRLPDMELLEGEWYYVYEHTKENRKLVGDRYSKPLFSKHNKFYIPAPHGNPQCVITLDSWVSLVPENMDEDDPNAGLAAVARLLSVHLPKIKGKLRRKNAILMGVNQLRERPMAQGDPRYEPGGQALRFQSDVRIWQTARALSAVGISSGGMIQEETSVTGEGTDKYRYIHMVAKKNKLAVPGHEGFARIWISDEDGVAHGFCPVFDLFEYLKMTGQLTGNQKKFTVKMEKGPEFKGNMLDLKKLVLLPKGERAAHAKKLGIKPTNLKALCLKQLKSGRAKELMYENRKAGAADEQEDEED